MSRPRWILVSVALLLVSTISLAQSRPILPDEGVPLRNWPIAVNTMDRAADVLTPESNALPSAASHFIEMVPCRVYDSRVAAGGPGPIPGATSRTIAVAGGPCAGIPTTAAGFSLNITVTGSSGGGNAFVTAYPTGTTKPGTSTVNFLAGAQVANAAMVPAGTGGAIDIYASTQTDVIVDINGYLVEGVVTNIVPGSGLSGGGTGNVGLSVATGGITNTHIAAAAGITESKLALNYPTHSNANDPTSSEKAAFVGTSGTPGAANRFVTDLDPRNADARPPLVHGSAVHDTTVASRVGGYVPTAELGSGTADATTFLRGDRTYAVAGAVKSSSYDIASATGLTTTPAEIKSLTVTFPAAGTALFLLSGTFSQPASGGAGFLNVRLLQDGTQVGSSWFWDPGDADGWYDVTQSFHATAAVTAGAHTYSLQVSTNTGTASAGVGEITVLFFPAAALP